MDNSTIFFYDTPPILSQTPTFTKPNDDFKPLSVTSSSVFYLAVITPHTDKYEVHGPVPSFAHLLPTIEDIVSDSPSAIDKLDALQYTALDVWGEQTKIDKFKDEGFHTLVVDGQRGTYTVLEVLREENKTVREALPAPVYVVTRHGPLFHPSAKVGTAVKLGNAKGDAATSTLVGSFVDRADAQTAANKAMDAMVAGLAVSRIEDWGKEGGGVLLAMGGQYRWEVRIAYDDEALRCAKEGADAEGAGVGWRL